MVLPCSSIGSRFYLAIFLVNCVYTAAHDIGMGLHCTNDYVELMSCQMDAPDNRTNCTEYQVHVEVPGSYRNTANKCDLTRDTVRTWTCSCSMKISSFVLIENYATTLRRASKKVESKNIPVGNNIKPKAPTINSVKRQNEVYEVEFNLNYNNEVLDILRLKVVLTYGREGENGTEEIVEARSSTYIRSKSLKPDKKYWVSMRSIKDFPSESSNKLHFTTPASPSNIVFEMILGLCVAAVIIASTMFFLLIRVKKKWWDKFGKYKNSTLLKMVPGEQKVLMPQKTILCSVYVDPLKEDKDQQLCFLSGNSYQSSEADSVSSSLGYSQKVSVDIFSDVENAMRKAFPQISLLPNTTPWLFMCHSNPGYNPAPLMSLENLTYQGLSGALPAVLRDSFSSPSMLRGVFHDPSPDSQVPIFQLTGQMQPLVSRQDSCSLKTSGSSLPEDDLWVDLSHSCYPSDATSPYIPSTSGSFVSGVCPMPELQRETSSGWLPGREADPASMTEHVHSQEEPSVKVCGSNPREDPRSAPACNLVSVDDDYQGFQSLVRRPGVLLPEESSGRPRDQLDRPSETLITAAPQRGIDTAGPSVGGPILPSIQGAQGLLQPQANTFSVQLADERQLVLISDYHSV